MASMSIEAYSRRRQVHRRAVQYRIERGDIVPTPDGMIDTEQADAAWTDIKGKQQGEDHRRKRQADVTAQLVKFNLLKVQLDRLQAINFERTTIEEVVAEEVHSMLAYLKATPERCAHQLAGELNIDEADARAILEDVIAGIMTDLGDFKGDATRLLASL